MTKLLKIPLFIVFLLTTLPPTTSWGMLKKDPLTSLLQSIEDTTMQDLDKMFKIIRTKKLTDPEKIEQLKKLLKCYPLCIYLENNIGRTVLEETILHKNRSLITFLIDYGADVNYETKKGETAFHFACRMGDFGIIKLLVDKGANIHNKTGIWGTTPLRIAVSTGNLELAKYLLKSGAEVDQKDNTNSTPLLYAVIEEEFNLEIIKLLLAYGANINHQDKFGYSSIHLAALANNVATLKFLVERGAKLDLKNNCNETALDTAHESLKFACVNYLTLVKAFYATLGNNIGVFNSFAENYLTTHQNIADVKNLLHLDKEKKFTNLFNEWCEKNNKKIQSANTTLNTNLNTFTTPNGLTNTNLCASVGNLNKK